MKSKYFTISKVLLGCCLMASMLFSTIASAQKPLTPASELQKMKELMNIDKSIHLHSDGAQMIFNKQTLNILTKESTWHEIIDNLNKEKVKSTELQIRMTGLTSADLAKFLKLMINNNYAPNVKTLMLMDMNTEQLNTLLAKASFLTNIEYASSYSNSFANPEAMIAAFAKANPNFHGIVGNMPLSSKLLAVYSQNPELSVMGGFVNSENAKSVISWLNKNPNRIKILNLLFSKTNTIETDIGVLKALDNQTNIRLFSVSLFDGKMITQALSQVLATTLSNFKNLHSFDLVGYTDAKVVASTINELAAWKHKGLDVYLNGTDFSKSPSLLKILLSDNRIDRLSLRNAGLTNTHLPVILDALKARNRSMLLVLTDNDISKVVPFVPVLKQGKISSLYISNASLDKNRRRHFTNPKQFNYFN